MTANYTKGEWKAQKAPIMGDWVVTADNGLICRVSQHFNARLVAAAPNMYEALKLMLNKDASNITSEEAIFAIKALAKAEGRN